MAKLLDLLEAFTGSRAYRLFCALEPAFVVLTVIGVAVAIFALWLDLSARKEERDARQEERVSRAWQTMTSTARGNTGKADALKYLAAVGQDLRWMHLAPGSTGNNQMVDCRYRAFIPGLDLRGVQLDYAHLSCSDLDSGDADTGTARFDQASLNRTFWIRTKAERANFRQASLIAADFRGARLGQADFTEADLTQAKFAYADLRGVSFSVTAMEGVNVHMADMRGVRGLTCNELKRVEGWESACRDSHLECNASLVDQCGPTAVPKDLRFPVSSGERSAISTPPTCDETNLQREIAFRLDQVDRVVIDKFGVEGVTTSDSCALARSIFVVAKLGGIVRRPPPKEDETVWIGSSGYGYRHTPFKTGARSDEFASFSLPELVADYASCTGSAQSKADSALQSAVKDFERATVAPAGDQAPECDKWIKDATDSWMAVRRTANRLAEIGRTQ